MESSPVIVPTSPHPRRRTFLKAGAVALGGGALVAGGTAWAGRDQPGESVRGLVSGQVGRWWISIGRSPSATEVALRAPANDVIVLNAWDLDGLRAARRTSPDTLVLVYKDLSSTRSYEGARTGGLDARLLPTGVGFNEAPDAWFARDRDGRRIEWAPFPGHLQMATWRADYRRRWVENVVADVERDGWDGVMADNDMFSLRFYTEALVAGTRSRSETDALLRRGQGQLVAEAGAALQRAGALLVTNVSEGRADLARWRQRASFGGAVEENFTSFLTEDGRRYLPARAWEQQTEQLGRDGISLLITDLSDGDDRAGRFAYTSALVRARGRVAWTPKRDGSYARPATLDLQEVVLGPPREQGEQLDSGIWARQFERGTVVVNPTSGSVDLRTEGLGNGALRAHDGLVRLGSS